MNAAVGNCSRCGSEATAVGDRLDGRRGLPFGDLATAQQIALWCSSCTQAFCGKCCGAVPESKVLKFRCPNCAGDVKWGRVEHLGMLR